MRRNLRDRDSPIYRDTSRGRGGIGGGLFTNGPSDTLASAAYDHWTTEDGSYVTTETEVRIKLS